MNSPIILFAVALFLIGCTQPSAQNQADTDDRTHIILTADGVSTPEVSEISKETFEQEQCDLKPIAIPKKPTKIPGYTQLDETTGLHMTGTPPEIDFASYRLNISGLMDHLLSLNIR